MSLQRITEWKGDLNAPTDAVLANVRSAIARGLPQVQPHDPTKERCIIAAGGPSLKTEFPTLYRQYKRGAKVVAVNGTHDWLVARGVIPSAYVMIDARPGNARFLRNPIPSCAYFIASQCAPEVFDALRDVPRVYIFHIDNSALGFIKTLDDYYFGHYFVVPGGSTVTLRALPLMRMLGRQKFDIYGMDACFLDGEHHAYVQAENEQDRPIKIVCADREFQCAPWMARQAEDFQQIVRHYGRLFKMRVHGDGLIAWMVKSGAQHWTELKQAA